MKETERKMGWEERMPLLASFLIPLIILLIICIDHGVYPFGERCILRVDMYHQYCPFFTELMEKLKTGGSLQYSWNIGLGADFVSLYAYYLASPLNWLLLLCPRGAVIEFMTILVLLKIALSGLTFACYLKYHFLRKQPCGETYSKKVKYSVAIFGCAYALSGFTAAYAWNIMWMDCILLAPLILLGLERLVTEKKPGFYYVTLALSILCNYYISIMICIFLVTWFFLTWIEHREAGIGAFFRFAWYSLLAGGTGAVLILPEAAILGLSGSGNISFPESVEWYFNIIAELGRQAVMTTPYTGRDHWPNLYCGVFVLVLVALYFLNGRISWKKKLPRGILIVFFIVSFANNVLDFIWHGFDFPDSLPGRQSFLYIFVLLVTAYEAFLELKGSRLWHVAAAFVGNGALLLAAFRLSDEEMIDVDAYVVTAVLLGCYALVVVFALAGKEGIRRLMLPLGGIMIIAETTLNYDVTGLGTTSRTAYVQALDDYRAVLDAGEEKADAEGILFYRTEELERKTKNDAPLYGYRSATQFSSLMNLNVSHFYQDIGMEGGKNFYCVNGATPLFSAMLSIKYVIADNALEANPIRTLIASSKDTYLYENKYVLPLGFMMPEDAASAWNYDAGDIRAQNELAHLLGAQEEMLSVIPSESEVGESTIKVERDAYIFATYEKTTLENLTEEISDGRTKNFTKVSHGYTLDLGYCEAGTEIKIKNTFDERLSITAYELNLESVDAAFQTLNEQTLALTEFSDTYVKGTIDVTEAGRLILSIAKEDGWTLYVDGAKTETEAFGEAFISTPLETGSHVIELCYRTPGLTAGGLVSVSCVVLFLVSMLIRRKSKIA